MKEDNSPLFRDDCRLTDPEGFYIGKDSLPGLQQTLFPASYTENAANDSINIPNPKSGTYTIRVYGEKITKDTELENGFKLAAYALGIRIDGSDEAMQAVNAPPPPSGSPPDELSYEVEEGCQYLNGDADGSGGINILDVTYIINYLYKGGPAPDPEMAGDANCSQTINILDVTYLINYLYKGGPAPCEIL